ncbi:hypothetical protein [Nocardiopsis changdeensis]|uniref:hypothetical protein n=1 Tax=Nocardiopsis changdeensis TaxID=2831969 RepID=UPI003F467C74
MRRLRGGPVAAGLMAFGAGSPTAWGLSESRAEQRAAQCPGEHARHEAGAAAEEMRGS